MKRASELFSTEDQKQIEQAVAQAEAKTSCEIMPVVATASGRYDRAEDIVGLWFGMLTSALILCFLPRRALENGNWGDMPLYVEILILITGMLLSFFIGAIAAAKIGWLRRLFTPHSQMKEEVAAKAREVFFDKRIHHTEGATGILIFVSLFEHQAVILSDQEILNQPTLGQPFIDSLCKKLTAELHSGNLTEAICQVLAEAGEKLAGPLPRAEDDVNELEDTLILID